tara:strand:- start:1478 stop:1612 length:135 start_codon:yes stop_codon:yes gene_type:complete
MIKKITLVLLIYCFVIACGKKGDPMFKDPNESAEIKTILVSKSL